MKVIHHDEPYSFQDTLEFVESVKQLSKETQLLIVDKKFEKDKIYQLIDAGVDGMCDKRTTSLTEAVQYMQEYSMYISYPYQKALVEEFQAKPTRNDSGEVMLQIDKSKAKEELTNREIEILEDLIMETGNSEEREERLYISPKTYKNYIARVMDKMEADNRTHIIPTTIKKGIIKTVVH